MVLERGVAWKAETYGSLSQVGKAMTGHKLERPSVLRTAKSDGSARAGV